MYLSALLAVKKGESQDKVVSLLNKTIELHLGAVRVCFLLLIFCHCLYLIIMTMFLSQNH